MYVVRTPLRCRLCGGEHEYITKGCILCVYSDSITAAKVASRFKGFVERVVEIPEGVPYHLFLPPAGRNGGRPVLT